MSGEEAGQATGCEAWPGANPACLSGYSSRVADIAVPKVGLEPTRGFPHRILSPARLPVPPLRLCRKRVRESRPGVADDERRTRG